MIGIKIVAMVGFVVLTGCSKPAPSDPPTQQEVHSADSGVSSGQLGRHRYRCDDGSRLLIDYKDDGLRLDLRDGNDASPRILSAPTQRLQYVGDGITATFSGTQLTIVEGTSRTRTCVQEGSK